MLGCVLIAFALCNPNYVPPGAYYGGGYSGGYAYAQSGGYAVAQAQPYYVVPQPVVVYPSYPVIQPYPFAGYGGISVAVGRHGGVRVGVGR